MRCLQLVGPIRREHPVLHFPAFGSTCRIAFPLYGMLSGWHGVTATEPDFSVAGPAPSYHLAALQDERLCHCALATIALQTHKPKLWHMLGHFVCPEALWFTELSCNAYLQGGRGQAQLPLSGESGRG